MPATNGKQSGNTGNGKDDTIIEMEMERVYEIVKKIVDEDLETIRNSIRVSGGLMESIVNKAE